MPIPSIILNSKTEIPAIGFGTWRITPDGAAETAVAEAIQTGYRHIDTAMIYSNETGVGAAIAASGVPREELFVTTKLWNEDQGYESALTAIDTSLAMLKLDYVDLYLVHWPQTETRSAAWKAMQDIYKSGKAKAVGVSNYTVRHLEELLASSDLVPAVNQVEFHPYIYEDQRELLAYCKQKGIIVEAYSPLSRHSREIDERILQIAGMHGKTASQVLLRWCIQHGTVPLPRSANAVHIQENIQVFDFELTSDQMETINGLSDGQRVSVDPETLA